MQPFSLLLATGLASAYTVTTVEQFIFKNIDPIVSPGQYVSHMHSFFRSDAVDATTSTSAELRRAARPLEILMILRVPTLYLVDKSAPEAQTHQPITPMRFSTYYELLNEAGIPIQRTFRYWACEGDETEEGNDLAAFPTRTCSTHLQTLLWFPDCVNPNTFETAYSKNPRAFEGYGENWCPAGMYKMARLKFSIRHGDFFNGWLPEAGEYMSQDPSKRAYFQVKGPLAAEDSDPEHGTSDYAESSEMMGKKADEDVTAKIRRHRRAAHRRV
ncbi:hypothetical protein BDW66DRAFT_164452 [Aspergillus desertorum]